jgi:hypothetical protein
MQFVGINYLAIALAAVAGFGVGFAWYGTLGNAWMRALGKTPSELKPRPAPFITSIIALLIAAYMLAGLIGHMGEVTLRNGVISGAFVWTGFVVTSIAVNYAFQGAKLALIAIDAGHWLAVLLVMGAVIGAMGV